MWIFILSLNKNILKNINIKNLIKKYQSQFFPKILTTHHQYNSYVHEPQHMYIFTGFQKGIICVECDIFSEDPLLLKQVAGAGFKGPPWRKLDKILQRTDNIQTDKPNTEAPLIVIPIEC